MEGYVLYLDEIVHIFQSEDLVCIIFQFLFKYFFQFTGADRQSLKIFCNLTLIDAISKEWLGETLQTDVYDEVLVGTNRYDCTIRDLFYFVAETSDTLAVVVEFVAVGELF